MGLFDRIDHHSTLMQRMADTVHADLGDALVRGELSGSELRGAVMSCMSCEGGADCPGWLEAHPEGAAEAPDYCRNRDLLHRLATPA